MKLLSSSRCWSSFVRSVIGQIDSTGSDAPLGGREDEWRLDVEALGGWIALGGSAADQPSAIPINPDFALGLKNVLLGGVVHHDLPNDLQ